MVIYSAADNCYIMSSFFSQLPEIGVAKWLETAMSRQGEITSSIIDDIIICNTKTHAILDVAIRDDDGKYFFATTPEQRTVAMVFFFARELCRSTNQKSVKTTPMYIPRNQDKWANVIATCFPNSNLSFDDIKNVFIEIERAPTSGTTGYDELRTIILSDTIVTTNAHSFIKDIGTGIGLKFDQSEIIIKMLSPLVPIEYKFDKSESLLLMPKHYAFHLEGINSLLSAELFGIYGVLNIKGKWYTISPQVRQFESKYVFLTSYTKRLNSEQLLVDLTSVGDETLSWQPCFILKCADNYLTENRKEEYIEDFFTSTFNNTTKRVMNGQSRLSQFLTHADWRQPSRFELLRDLLNYCPLEYSGFERLHNAPGEPYFTGNPNSLVCEKKIPTTDTKPTGGEMCLLEFTCTTKSGAKYSRVSTVQKITDETRFFREALNFFDTNTYDKDTTSDKSWSLYREVVTTDTYSAYRTLTVHPSYLEPIKLAFPCNAENPVDKKVSSDAQNYLHTFHPAYTGLLEYLTHLASECNNEIDVLNVKYVIELMLNQLRFASWNELHSLYKNLKALSFDRPTASTIVPISCRHLRFQLKDEFDESKTFSGPITMFGIIDAILEWWNAENATVAPARNGNKGQPALDNFYDNWMNTTRVSRQKFNEAVARVHVHERLTQAVKMGKPINKLLCMLLPEVVVYASLEDPSLYQSFRLRTVPLISTTYEGTYVTGVATTPYPPTFGAAESTRVLNEMMLVELYAAFKFGVAYKSYDLWHCNNYGIARRVDDVRAMPTTRNQKIKDEYDSQFKVSKVEETNRKYTVNKTDVSNPSVKMVSIGILDKKNVSAKNSVICELNVACKDIYHSLQPFIRENCDFYVSCGKLDLSKYSKQEPNTSLTQFMAVVAFFEDNFEVIKKIFNGRNVEIKLKEDMIYSGSTYTHCYYNINFVCVNFPEEWIRFNSTNPPDFADSGGDILVEIDLTKAPPDQIKWNRRGGVSFSYEESKFTDTLTVDVLNRYIEQCSETSVIIRGKPSFECTRVDQLDVFTSPQYGCILHNCVFNVSNIRASRNEMTYTIYQIGELSLPYTALLYPKTDKSASLYSGGSPSNIFNIHSNEEIEVPPYAKQFVGDIGSTIITPKTNLDIVCGEFTLEYDTNVYLETNCVYEILQSDPINTECMQRCVVFNSITTVSPGPFQAKGQFIKSKTDYTVDKLFTYKFSVKAKLFLKQTDPYSSHNSGPLFNVYGNNQFVTVKQTTADLSAKYSDIFEVTTSVRKTGSSRLLVSSVPSTLITASTKKLYPSDKIPIAPPLPLDIKKTVKSPVHLGEAVQKDLDLTGTSIITLYYNGMKKEDMLQLKPLSNNPDPKDAKSDFSKRIFKFNTKLGFCKFICTEFDNQQDLDKELDLTSSPVDYDDLLLYCLKANALTRSGLGDVRDILIRMFTR